MKALAPFKRGDTFMLTCSWLDDGVRTSVAGLSLRSQIRTQAGKLVSQLDVVLADQMQSPGGFRLQKTDTSSWPVGTLYCDIEVEDGGVVRSSETFQVPVSDRVTQ